MVWGLLWSDKWEYMINTRSYML